MIGLATPLPAYSEARAGGLRDLGLRDSESPSRSIVRELVQATRAEADKLFERIVSVEDGIKDARIIHQVANDSLTLLKGMALPLLECMLSSDADSPSMDVATPQLEKDTPSTRTTQATGSSGQPGSSESSPRAQSQHSATPSTNSKASDASCRLVKELRGVTTLDGVTAPARPSCRMSAGRKHCVRAEFTRKFANSLFQGRGTHALDSFRSDEAKRVAKRKRAEGEVIEPIRLFGSGESPPDITESPSTSTGKRCSSWCCRSNSSVGALAAAEAAGSSCAAGEERGDGPVPASAAAAGSADGERTPQDAAAAATGSSSDQQPSASPRCSCCPISQLQVRCDAQYLSLSETMGIETEIEGSILNPDGCQAAAAVVLTPPPAPHDHGATVTAESEEQPASRDPGGEDRMYSDPFLQTMDGLERELQIAFQKCENDRLQAARVVGWIRRDIDWTKKAFNKPSGGQEESPTVSTTVQVPARGPKRKVASSSGDLSNSGIRHRRLMIAQARALYLCAAIRQHHEGSLVKDKPDALRLAAVRAILDDLPLEFLRYMAKDSRMQDVSIISEKQMRKRVLKDIKKEAAEARQDPMTVLKATIEHSKRAGSIKAYRGMQAILNKSGFGHCLPSDEQMTAAKKGIMRLAESDLEIITTPDGYRINLKRAVEMEASRIMQTIATSESGKVEVRTVGVQPGGYRWQDLFDVKITFDARRVTKHGSQTEVMMIFVLKGQEGVDRCQKALEHRTLAVWAGKDSRENVQRNLVGMLKEAKELEENGVVFSVDADSFLAVQESPEFEAWMKLPEDTRKSMIARNETGSFHTVGIRFWVPADMLAQCSLLGQGCAGKQYCAHCNAHKDTRHIPFELRLVPERVNFRKLADELDLHADTLWSINTSADQGENWKFNEEGLRFMTAPSDLVVSQPEPASAKAAKASGASAGKAPAKRAAVPEKPAAPASILRAGKKSRAQPKPAASSAADCASNSNRDSNGRALGPDVEKLSKLNTWRVHDQECLCDGCAVPANTVVRTMMTHGFSRPSAFLKEHWPQMTAARCPFCALHCLMRVTEAMFQQICQFAMAGGEEHLRRLNEGLLMAGFKSKKFEKLRHFDSSNYEKLSFLGHESLHLLKRSEPGGDRNIAVILKHLWPRGDAPQRADQVNGARFVARSVDLWEKWARVVELMTERDPQTVRSKNGFATFGKDCRDFIFLFQAMFHKAQCKAFYLHTLMAHAGDFMRELGKYDMCLGMMSNSGAERRHEYGRRAFKRSLCGGCWAKTNKDLAEKQNLSAYLTLREILVWQYGSDLLSHEMALRAAAASSDGPNLFSSRRKLVVHALRGGEEDQGTGTDGASDRPPLLSMEEVEEESRRDCDLGKPACSLETGSDGWITVEHDKSKALESVPFEGEWESGKPLPPGVQMLDGKLVYVVGRDAGLTNGIADWLSDCSGDGSEDDCDSEDGSDRFEDLAAFASDSDSEDGEYDPELDRRVHRIRLLTRNGTVGVGRLEEDDLELMGAGPAVSAEPITKAPVQKRRRCEMDQHFVT